MQHNISTGKIFTKCIVKTFLLINQYSKLYIFINFLFITLQGIIPALLILIMQETINLLQKNIHDFFDLLYLVFLYIGINIFNIIITSAYNYYNAKVNMSFSNYINLKMLHKSSELGVRDFENPDTYDIINRAQTQNGNNIIAFISEIFIIIKSIITIGSTILILVKLNWWMIIIVLIVPIIECMLTIVIDKKWYMIRKERTSKERRKWYINYLMMMGNAKKEIKIFHLSNYMIHHYNITAENIIKQDLTMQKKIIFINFILDLTDWFITGSIYVYIFFKGFKGVLLIGDVTAYINGIEKIKENTTIFFQELENLIEQSLYIDFLFQYFEIPIKMRSGNIKISNIQKIQLINVSYKYNNMNYVLKNVNMILTKDTHIALVGENGSGKTTLIKLIMGLYEDYEGEIFVNDINLKNIDLEDYQKRISCIFQDYIKYEMSIRENVSFGDVKNIFNDKLIWEKLEKVCLKNKVSKFSSLDLNLGNWFGELQLSGGEWQRIAIARMLMRKSEILILDEPDASLDILKQKELIKIYKNEIENIISIFISHKVDYVHLIANHIYVLEKGDIVEHGSHEELLNIKGKYYKLFVESIHNTSKIEEMCYE